MNDWARKEEEYINKIKQLEEERKLFQDYTKLNVNNLIATATTQNADKENLLSVIE